MKPRNYTEIARGYEEDILANRIPSGRLIKLACVKSRELRLEQERNPTTSPFKYSKSRAHQICAFQESFVPYKQKKSEERYGLPRILDPWSIWFDVNLFGWIKRDTGTRKHRHALLQVARGAGKSEKSSNYALYMLGGTGEGGAEVYCAATKLDQAKRVYDVSRNLLQFEPNHTLRDMLGLECRAHRIIQPSTFSYMVPVPAESKSMDGLDPYYISCDEIHEWHDSNLWYVLRNGMGKRDENLMVAITTAGSDISTVGYDRYKYSQAVLEGAVRDDSYWCAVYEPDEGDDWHSEETWIKANPAWNSFMDKDDFLSSYNEAKTLPAARADFMVKRLNMWGVKSKGYGRMSDWKIAASTTLDPEAYMGRKCFIGVDLAFTNDISAVSIMFPYDKFNTATQENETHYDVLNLYYLPEERIEEDPKNSSFYKRCRDKGLLTEHRGTDTNPVLIAEDILDLCEHYDVQYVGVDPYGSKPLINRLEEALGEDKVFKIRQTTMELTAATKQLEYLSRVHCVHFDKDDEMILWMLSNVELYTDSSGNVKPDKAKSTNKIDGVASTIDALVLALNAKKPIKSIYADDTWEAGIEPSEDAAK